MTNPSATPEELLEVKRLDPERLEGWNYRIFGSIAGLEFTYRIPYVDFPEYFKFLAVKESSCRWWICPLYPNLDGVIAHKDHMTEKVINGARLSVLCGPEGRSATSLVEVREFAAKWAHYIAQHLNGRQPGFSE